MNARRQLTSAVIGCVAGAGLALFAATRTWSVDVMTRPEPLPPTRTPHTGPAWLSALAVVALAGAGALIATRGTGRTVVAVLLVATGLGIAAGGIGEATRVWPALTAAGGLVVVAAGAVAVARGRGWQSMGTRYERARNKPADVDMWAALDRGEDPTS